MNPIRIIVAAIALAGPALSVHASGGGMSDVIVSVPKGQPEPAALAGYLHGHLGVLWSTYDRQLLMMAYRQAMGHAAMSDGEAAGWIHPAPAMSLGDDWLAARREAGVADTAGPASAGARATSAFSYAGNCQPDAFRLAAVTLSARAKTHASEAAAVKDWIAGQDAVFAACDKPDAAAPADAPGGAPAWLRRDRAYQRAAWQLYVGHDDAATAFAAIAADPDSAWREWAAYLQARLWWRDTFKQPADYRQFATQSKDWRHEPMPLQLTTLSAKARDPEVREAAAGLLRALQARIEPVETHRALWRRIDAVEPPADFAGWVADERFLWALMKEDDALDDWLYLTRSISNGDAAARRAADLSVTWGGHPTPPWLATALLAAHPDTPGLESALAASRALEPDDPLYLHCAWQRTRLALERNDVADARRELGAAQAHLGGEAMGTRQAFDQLTMLAAPSLQALGEHVQRKALARESFDDDVLRTESIPAGTPPDFIDDETRAWLAAHVDGQEMLQLARDARLAKNVRVDLAGGAWLRGALLNQDTLEADAVKQLAALGVQADAAAAATPPEQRFRMARHLLLNEVVFIGTDLQPDLSANPWWKTPASFHDAATTARIAKQATTLSAANRTTWLGQAMLPWLRAHKSAEGPALLEKLVYASRYGQQDKKTSREAFQQLHAQYPNSPEAQRTRYYF